MAEAYIDRLEIRDKGDERRTFEIRKQPLEKALCTCLIFCEDKYDLSIKKLAKRIEEMRLI